MLYNIVELSLFIGSSKSNPKLGFLIIKFGSDLLDKS